MKKMLSVILLIVISVTLSSDVIVDSLKKEIDSLPFSYLKGDKIWDLALYQGNSLNQPGEAIKNYLKATEMFVQMDSLASAIKTNGSVIIVAYNNPEYYESSKIAFARILTFLADDKLSQYKLTLFSDARRHLKNAYFLKEMEHLREGLTQLASYFDSDDFDEIKIDLDQLAILNTHYFFGEEKALEESMKTYQAIENDEYNVSFGTKQSMRVKVLSLMQNYHFYRGNIEQSNQLLDEAMDIALDVYQNHIDSLSAVQKIIFRADISQLMTLKTDNIELTENNLNKIERGYLDVNKFAKSFDPEREVNNFVKIAHAYDVIYSGKHPKINFYLNKAEERISEVTNITYQTNFYLTKARYLLNNKDYQNADVAFKKVEESIDKANQSWLKFNYVMERSRYYFEKNKPKIAYDMITEFYTTIDTDFSENIAEKTAELNNLLETQKLINEQKTLKSELEIKSLQSSREKLITTLIGIVLGFITLLLVNNVRMNKRLKTHLSKQSEQLKKEMLISQKRAEELIVSEKLSTTGQIASSIAHEIKNPLTNIITAAKLLRDSKNNDELQKYFSICERNSWLAIDNINALLEYAKQKKMNFQMYSLKSILKEAYNLTKGSVGNTGIDLRLIYETHDDVTKIDPKEISGVIVNLILNSVQAMPDDSNNKKIDVTLSSENSNFVIKVIDNGIGIPASRIPKLFTPFYTTKDGGTGLGLSYAQKVIIEHHGSIKVESKVNQGTTVVIKLPKDQIVA